MNMIVDDFSGETLGVRLHAFHQRGTEQSVRVAGPVVHLRGGHELSALFHTGDQQGFAVGACGIDGGGVTRGAGSQDDERAVTRSAHV